MPHRVKTCTQSKLAHLNSCDHNNCSQMRRNSKWRQRPCSWWGISPSDCNQLTCDTFPYCRCHHTAPCSAEAWPTHAQGKCSSGWRAGWPVTLRVVVQFPPLSPWSRHLTPIAWCKHKWLFVAGGARGHRCRLASIIVSVPPQGSCGSTWSSTPPPVVVQWTIIPGFVHGVGCPQFSRRTLNYFPWSAPM